MLCNECGHENLNKASFCSACGNRHSQSPPPLTAANIGNYAPPSTISSPDNLDNADTLLSAFVGEKYQGYYRDKWFKDRAPSLELPEKGTNVQSFNLAALLLGAFWLCYRKMYKVAFLLMVGITLIDLVLMYLLGMTTYNKFGNSALMIGPAVFMGILGNHLYLKHTLKQIKSTTSSLSDPSIIQQQLVTQGGTTWLGGIGGTLLLLAMIGVLYYLLAPSWLWV